MTTHDANPFLVLMRLMPTSVKVYFAICYLRNKFGPPEAFAATSTALQEITGLSQPTVVQARHELVKFKLIYDASPPGYYSLDGPSYTAILQAATGLKNILGASLLLEPKKESLSLEVGGSPAVAQGLKPPSGVRRPKNLKPAARVVGGRVFGGLTIEDRRELVSKACLILGSPRTGRYMQMAMSKLAGLLRDGFTADDVIEVVRYARARYDGGDRFMPHLNLLHVWSAGRFTPLLTAARTTPFHEKAFSVLDPAAADRFKADYLRRVRERS